MKQQRAYLFLMPLIVVISESSRFAKHSREDLGVV